MALVSCNYSVRASNWKVLPSQGTDGHSVHLLKTLFAPCGRDGEGVFEGLGMGRGCSVFPFANIVLKSGALQDRAR